DEVEGRAALHRHRLAGVVGDDEDRRVERRLVAPPAVPRVVLPGTVAAEHVPAHHDGADVLDGFLDYLAGGVDLAALHAVALAPRLEPDCPLVKLLPALAQRVLQARVRPGD